MMTIGDKVRASLLGTGLVAWVGEIIKTRILEGGMPNWINFLMLARQIKHYRLFARSPIVVRCRTPCTVNTHS